jgi:hypothetical protein
VYTVNLNLKAARRKRKKATSKKAGRTTGFCLLLNFLENEQGNVT